MRSISISEPESILTLGAVAVLSPISAPKPLPSGCLTMIYDLLCQLHIAFGTARSRVVNNYRLAKTGSFGEPYVPWNDGVEDLRAIEVSKILCNGCGEISSLVEHC